MGTNLTKSNKLTWVHLLIGVALIWACDLGLGIAQAILTLAFKLDSMTPLSIFVTSILSTVWTFAVIGFIVCYRRKLSFFEGFKISRPDTPSLTLYVLLGIGMAIFGNTLYFLFSTHDSIIEKIFNQPYGLLVICVMALVLPPFEELYYRGFLYPCFKNLAGARWALVIVTLWFTMAHAIQLFGDPIGLPVILVVALVLTIQRHRSDSLTPSLITHWVYNFGIIVATVVAEV